MFPDCRFTHPRLSRGHRVLMVVCALLWGAAAHATEIGGLVTLDAGGAPVTEGYVQIHRASGAYIGLASIGNDGRYRYSGLAQGSYVARTSDTGVLDELWNNVPCAQKQCAVTSGTPIVVGSQPVVADFSLVTGGAIAGTVTAQGTGAPIADGYVIVYDASGTYLGLTGIGNDGRYRYSGLAVGYYRVRTDSTGLADELWNNQPCAQGACTYPAGSPVVVATGGATTVADFSLDAGGAISGAVTATAGGAPIGDGTVVVYDDTGGYLGLVGIANNGTFRYGGLAPGNYFVRTDSTGYLDELWNNLPCADGVCVVTQGTPVAVASAPVQLAFSLQSGGGIQGTVTRRGSSTPVTDGYVVLHGADGGYLGLTGMGTMAPTPTRVCRRDPISLERTTPAGSTRSGTTSRARRRNAPSRRARRSPSSSRWSTPISPWPLAAPWWEPSRDRVVRPWPKGMWCSTAMTAAIWGCPTSARTARTATPDFLRAPTSCGPKTPAHWTNCGTTAPALRARVTC